MEVGKLTGIKVVPDKNIVQRKRSWKKRTINLTSVTRIENNPIKKNIETYAIRRALQLQSEGQISFTQVSDNVDEMYPSCPEEFAPDFEYNSGWAK
jgi:hypothetical protein